ILVDLCKLNDSLFVFAVVRRAMETAVDTTLRERAPGGVAAEFERRYASHVSGEGHNLEVEHQLHVLFPVVRYADRRRRQLSHLTAGVPLFAQLNSSFDLSNVLEVLIHSGLIHAGQIRLQTARLVADPVEDAGFAFTARRALGCIAAGAE